jgi:hypothetical protein
MPCATDEDLDQGREIKKRCSGHWGELLWPFPDFFNTVQKSPDPATFKRGKFPIPPIELDEKVLLLDPRVVEGH